jgi:hypothetical protein
MTGSRRHLDRALAHPEKPCVRRLPRARAHAPRAARQSTRPQVPSPQRFRAL